MTEPRRPEIYVDADACPVKDETYRVGRRHSLKVWVVANAVLRVPAEDRVECVVVGGGFDAADDWIVEHVQQGDLLVTTDLLLADRAIAKGAFTLTPKGKEYTRETIGGAVASRALMDQLRQQGTMTGGPAPFTDKDRSRFLAELERVVRAAERALASPP